MSPIFGKKHIVLALAEVLEDGRALAARVMQKPKYRDYAGAEPMLDIAVRVQPENDVAFEVKMKAGLSKTCLLVPGVRVQVKYESGKQQRVTLDDEPQAILDRNPQLSKKQ